MTFSSSPQLHLAGILATLALAGCGSGHSSNGGTGYATFTWSVFDTQGVEWDCASIGAGSVVVTLMDQATGTVYTQNPVSCVDLQMSTANVPTGSYTAGFDLFGDPAIYGNATTIIDSFSAGETFHILAGANDFTGKYAAFAVRSFVVGWAFLSGSAASLCASVGAWYVDLDITTSAGATAVTSRFDCATGSGISFPYPYGPSTAQWRLYLVDSTNQHITYIDGGSVELPPLGSPPADVFLGTQYFSS